MPQPLSQTVMSPARGAPAPPALASVISIRRAPWLPLVARSALSTSSASAYGNGERPCAPRSRRPARRALNA